MKVLACSLACPFQGYVVRVVREGNWKENVVAACTATREEWEASIAQDGAPQVPQDCPILQGVTPPWEDSHAAP